jgi:broad specificity phosphatase PhoE
MGAHDSVVCMKRIAVVVLLVLAACAQQPPTVLIVRHAEKGAGSDPDLTPAGVARANALAAVAQHAGIEAAFVTQYKRTKETAAPLHVPMIVVPINLNAPGDYPQRLAEAIKSHKVVLVVSHSNVVPAIVEQLAHVKVPPLGDMEYDRLYVVTGSRVVAAQYGH